MGLERGRGSPQVTAMHLWRSLVKITTALANLHIFLAFGGKGGCPDGPRQTGREIWGHRITETASALQGRREAHCKDGTPGIQGSLYTTPRCIALSDRVALPPLNIRFGYGCVAPFLSCGVRIRYLYGYFSPGTELLAMASDGIHSAPLVRRDKIRDRLVTWAPIS